jgi:hypothetical protein
MGSNKVLQVALGKTPSDEFRAGLHELSERLKGNVGLLFTRLQREEVGPAGHCARLVQPRAAAPGLLDSRRPPEGCLPGPPAARCSQPPLTPAPGGGRPVFL